MESEHKSRIIQYNSGDLHRLGKSTTIDKINPITCTRLKQFGFLRYRGSRGEEQSSETFLGHKLRG